MTVAVCVKCGILKQGAFNPCDSCGYRPTDDRDRAYSLALTDHYFTVATLREIGAVIPEKGVPSLPPEQERELLAIVRNPGLRRMLPARAAEATAANGNTSFIKRWFGRRKRT